MNRHTDQRNRIQSPEIYLSVYGQLILVKGNKKIKWNKNSLFNKWCWETRTATCKKVKLDHRFTPYTKINSKWIKDLTISRNNIRVIEENIGRKVSQIPHGNIFTNMSLRASDIKEGITKCDYAKWKFLHG